MIERAIGSGLRNCAMAILAMLPGPVALGQERIRSEIETALGRLETWSDVAACRDELVGLGPTALEEIFAALGPASEVSVSDPIQRAALEGVFASYPRQAVVSVLVRVRNRAEPERLLALHVLARVGNHDDVGLALELALGEERDQPVLPGLRSALEEALLAFHERDPATTRALMSRFEHAPPALQATLVKVIARNEDGLTILAGLLGTSPASDGVLLLEMSRLASTPGEPKPPALERVRGYLGHPNGAYAILAVVILEKLSDQEAVPDLIALLDHQDRNVKLAAYRALCGLTGVRIEASSRAWLEWLDEELAWWDGRDSDCREALASGSATTAAEAILELAHRHLYRDRAAEILTHALVRTETDLVMSACRALGGLRSKSSVPALAALAGHPEPQVRSAAQRALRSIEGQSNISLASGSIPRLPSEN